MHYIHMHEIASANAVHKMPKIQWIAKLQTVMLSPIKTPFFLLNVWAPKASITNCYKCTYTHTRVHPHTKHLHLSNIKVVMQSNTSQKSKFKLGSLLVVVSIVHIRVLVNMLLISFTGEMNLMLYYYIHSFLNLKEMIFCMKLPPCRSLDCIPLVLVILRSIERRRRNCCCHFQFPCFWWFYSKSCY